MSKLIAIYEQLCPDRVSKDDPRRAAIIAEMRSIKAAKTNKDAAKIIEWWGWDNNQELMSFVARARKLLGVQQPRKANGHK